MGDFHLFFWQVQRVSAVYLVGPLVFWGVSEYKLDATQTSSVRVASGLPASPLFCCHADLLPPEHVAWLLTAAFCTRSVSSGNAIASLRFASRNGIN